MENKDYKTLMGLLVTIGFVGSTTSQNIRHFFNTLPLLNFRVSRRNERNTVLLMLLQYLLRYKEVGEWKNERHWAGPVRDAGWPVETAPGSHRVLCSSTRKRAFTFTNTRTVQVFRHIAPLLVQYIYIAYCSNTIYLSIIISYGILGLIYKERRFTGFNNIYYY